MIDHNEKVEHAKRFKLGVAQLPISNDRVTNLDGNAPLNLQKGRQISNQGRDNQLQKDLLIEVNKYKQ